MSRAMIQQALIRTPRCNFFGCIGAVVDRGFEDLQKIVYEN